MKTQPEGQTPRNVCKHGQLARSCEICELELENAELRQQLATRTAECRTLRNAAVIADERREAAEARTVELQERLAMFEAITSGSQHMAVDRAILKGNSNGQG